MFIPRCKFFPLKFLEKVGSLFLRFEFSEHFYPLVGQPEHIGMLVTNHPAVREGEMGLKFAALKATPAEKSRSRSHGTCIQRTTFHQVIA